MPELAVPTPAIVQFLSDILGRDLVAYVACADRNDVKEWLHGHEQPTPLQEEKLRACFDCTAVIGSMYDAETARAWLFGSPAAVDGNAPARLIRMLGRHDVDATTLENAARSFCWPA